MLAAVMHIVRGDQRKIECLRKWNQILVDLDLFLETMILDLYIEALGPKYLRQLPCIGSR